MILQILRICDKNYNENNNSQIISRIDVHDMMRKAHMWCVTTNNSIDSEDSKYVEQVCPRSCFLSDLVNITPNDITMTQGLFLYSLRLSWLTLLNIWLLTPYQPRQYKIQQLPRCETKCYRKPLNYQVSYDQKKSVFLFNQVVQLHTQMVKWMVHILLRLAPDRPGTSKESIEQSLINSPPVADLVDEAKILFQQLDRFSLLIHG